MAGDRPVPFWPLKIWVRAGFDDLRNLALKAWLLKSEPVLWGSGGFGQDL